MNFLFFYFVLFFSPSVNVFMKFCSFLNHSSCKFLILPDRNAVSLPLNWFVGVCVCVCVCVCVLIYIYIFFFFR